MSKYCLALKINDGNITSKEKAKCILFNCKVCNVSECNN